MRMLLNDMAPKSTTPKRTEPFRNNDTTMRQILTSTRTVALVGASDNVERPSNEVMRILQEYGYRVIPINPRLKGQILLGEPVLGGLDELPSVLLLAEDTRTSGDGNINPVNFPNSQTIMVDIFRRSESAGEIVDQAIALGGITTNLISSIWMQIGVVDNQAAQRAMAAGFAVAMNVCPAEEIPRLGITVPAVAAAERDDKGRSARTETVASIESSKIQPSPAKRRRRR